MPFCVQCGASLPGNARFCGRCGSPVTAPGQAATYPDNPPIQYQQQPYAPPYQQPSYPQPGYYGQQPVDIGSSGTLVLVAYIFAIITVVLLVISGLFSLGVAASLGPYGGSSVFAGILSFIWSALSGYVTKRISAIRSAMKEGDIVSAYKKNSVGFGILAIFFGGVIPGILLLIARGSLARGAGATV